MANEKKLNDVTNRIRGLNQLSDLSTKEIADEGGYADIVAKDSKALKTNQLRKFFGAVRLLEQKTTWEEIEPDFYLLKPKLAVAVGRKNVPKQYYSFMMAAMSKVDVGSEEEKMKNFKTFIDFFESIVAYHKFYEL